jgi:endonuclease-8
VPEGDTLFRTAAVLREALLGRTVRRAWGRPGGPALERLRDRRVESVEARGKHLLIGLSGGLTLHTHLRMHGSWHRYRPREAWRRSPARAVAVLEMPEAVAVCFDAPTVELLPTRGLAHHPVLGTLGPDLLDPGLETAAVAARLGDRALAAVPLGEALLDQTILAGLGNVYRSEVCFLAGLDPTARLGDLDPAVVRHVAGLALDLLRANRLRPARATTPDLLGASLASSGPRRPGQELWVYRRTGRPCRRCGTPIRSAAGGALARRWYWCPRCQPRPAAAPMGPA